MYRFRYVVLAVAVLAIASLACLSTSASASGGGSAPTLEDLPEGNVPEGEALFKGSGGEGVAACSACHSLTGDSGVGPSLAGISERAGSTKADLSAEAYIYESITNPDAYVVDGFHESIMPAEFGHVLSPQQLADLLAFLMTQ